MDVSTPRTPTLGVRSSDYTRIRDRSMDLTLLRSNRSADFSINGMERQKTKPKKYRSTKNSGISKVKMERAIILYQNR
jgi:hypothetical protein